jgi:hypothetical protein
MPYPILKFEFNKNHSYDNSGLQHFFFEDYFGNPLGKEKYKYAKSFNEGYAFVYKHDKSWDIIDSIGESVFKKFRFSKNIKSALNCVFPRDGFFLKNYVIADNLIISVDCAKLKNEFDSLNLKVNGYPTPLNRQGHLVMNMYDGGMLFSLIEDYSLSGNGLIAIKHFDKDWTYISVKSFNRHWLEKYEFDEKFEFACGFVDGMAKVKKDGCFGFIDTTGKFAIQPIYDDARSFSEGYAAVAIANCREFPDWNNNERTSDLAWNFIDKNNNKLLINSKDNLSRIDRRKNYYFEDNSSRHSSAYENLNPNYFLEMSLQGFVCPNNFSGPPHSDFWYAATVYGQFSPNYLCDFLTAQIGDELGFKKWWVNSNCYNKIRSRSKIEGESIFIDFDTTQMEFDYINESNSLASKYGINYTSGNWKTQKRTENFGRNRSYDNTDWSNYNDNLDMDQQSPEFWNQF